MKPWERYHQGLVDEAPKPADSGVDWEDVGKGAVGGFGRGTAGLVGMPGTIGDLTRAGLRKVGVPEKAINLGASFARMLPFTRAFTGPDAGDVQKAIEARTGKFYVPHTILGQYASTVGEFAPSALLPGGGSLAARAVNTVIPALASETAGQLTKGTMWEPYARAAAGIGGGFVGARLITPTAPISAARQNEIDLLTGEGIPLSAGQRTGSKTIQMLESNAADMPFSARRAAELQGERASAYDRAVTNRVFDRNQLTARGVGPDVNLPSADAWTAGRQSLNDEYARLSGQNRLQSDPRLHSDLFAAQTNYERNVLPSARAGGASDVEQIRNEIVDKLIAGQGQMAGDEYQALRSRLGTLAKSKQASDPYLAGALRDQRTALDQAMWRSLTPEDAAAWQLNNQRWSAMKQVAGPTARAGENLSPAGVAQAVRAGRNEAFNARRGPLDDLAQAGSAILREPPNSGTAARLGWQRGWGIPAALSGGGGWLGSTFGPVGTAVGVAAPHALSRLALSGPVQGYLANQWLPQTAGNIARQTITEQLMTQPEVIRRNKADMDAFDAEIEANRRAQGLP